MSLVKQLITEEDPLKTRYLSRFVECSPRYPSSSTRAAKHDLKTVPGEGEATACDILRGAKTV